MTGIIGRDTILASASPRRRELLDQIGIGYTVVPSNIDEELGDFPTIKEALGDLALRKGLAVAQGFPGSIVVSADTSVVLDDEIYGKPVDDGDALRMLRALSGREHRVMTGLALVCIDEGIRLVDTETTLVSFRPLDDGAIMAYLATGEHRDKAGAYAIQGYGSTFVERINGCYSNVVGLPISMLCGFLDTLGIPVWSRWGEE